VTPAALAKLPAVFKKGGSTTAGNSSQVQCLPFQCRAIMWTCLGLAGLLHEGLIRPMNANTASRWLRPSTAWLIVARLDIDCLRGCRDPAAPACPHATVRLCSHTARSPAQVSDGAGAVLLMTRREAHRRQLPVLGVFRSFSAVGVDPAIMGVGPSVRLACGRLRFACSCVCED